MEYKALSPRKSLNKAFLKVKPNRSDVERFKTGLVTLLDRINLNETEEFHKNLLADFLKRAGFDSGCGLIPDEVKIVERVV